MAPRVMPAREATSSSDVRSQPFSPMISAAARIKAARVRSRLSPFGRPFRPFCVVFAILFIVVFNTRSYIIAQAVQRTREDWNMYSANIEIAATPPQVFAVLTDPKLAKQWQPAVVEVKHPEGGLRVGATAQAVVQEFGRRFSVEWVIAALEPN